jgi:TonB-linked SusC/RagA family outer membrane protein
MRIIKFFQSGLLAFMLVLSFLAAMAQKVTISGVVTDNENRPIPGVTVNVKGTNINAQTSNEGKYSIAVPDQNSFLTFRYVGYISRELATPKGTTLNVKLQESVIQTEDVVVIGYGTVKKKDLTGSVGRVNIEEMTKAPVPTFDQALAGRVAGVQVSATDGQPGSQFNILIRGANSVSQSNAPLYVIDGFPVEDFNTGTLNPADIESLEILKDASATAIYGARGANGVVMITTKRGKSGAPVIKYNGFYGLSQEIKRMKVMSPYDYVKYQIEVNPTGGPFVPGGYPTPSQLFLSGGTTLEYYRDTATTLDVQDQLFQHGPATSHSVSVTGGNDKTKYAISGNIFDQKGIIITSAYKRYQGRFSLDQTFSDKLKVGINANYSYQQQDGLPVGGLGWASSLSLMYSAWGYRPVNPSPKSTFALANPNFEIDQEDGLDPTVNPTQDFRFNPYQSLRNTFNRNINKDLLANAYVEYRFTPELVLKVTGGVNDKLAVAQRFYNSKTQSGYPGSVNGPNGSISDNNFNSLLNENYLTYTKNINKVHNIVAVVGTSTQWVKTSAYGFAAIKVPNDQLGINSIQGAVPNSVFSTASNNSVASFLARVNYSYNSKYLFTVSYRADGTSKFAPENRWAYFPSAAVAWNISDEQFMKGSISNIISKAKLKTSYGKTGNNRVDDFAYLTRYAQDAGGAYPFNNIALFGAYPAAIGNTKLKWETTGQTDLGLELGFLKNRIGVEVYLYKKVTSDLLLFASVPPSSGYSQIYKNIGKVQNQGLEVTLNTTNIQSKDFSWTSSFNISFNRNKLLQLAENQEAIGRSTGFSNGFSQANAYIAKIGQPLGLMYGLVFDGVYQYSDFDQPSPGVYTLKSNIAGNGAGSRASIRPGDVKYRDLNGDGTINTNDYTVIGRSLPIHTGGFNNNFRYKNFDLNVFFQWSYGNDIQNLNKAAFMGGNTGVNQYEAYKDRWTPANPNSDIPRASGFATAYGGYSSYSIEDGSFLRLKTLALGYTVPASVLKRLKIQSIRAYSSVQNLFTWTKYSGQDPEVSLLNNILTGGLDFSSYPKARTITMGLDITF